MQTGRQTDPNAFPENAATGIQAAGGNANKFLVAIDVPDAESKGHQLGNNGCQGHAHNAPVENKDKEQIQYDV